MISTGDIEQKEEDEFHEGCSDKGLDHYDEDVSQEHIHSVVINRVQGARANPSVLRVQV